MKLFLDLGPRITWGGGRFKWGGTFFRGIGIFSGRGVQLFFGRWLPLPRH